MPSSVAHCPRPSPESPEITLRHQPPSGRIIVPICHRGHAMDNRLTCCVILTLTLTGLASGQGKPTGGKGPTSSPTSQPPQHRPARHELARRNLGQRAFLTGKVVLDDGTQLTESASIQTICRGRRQTVTHTDSHGGFSFELGDRMSTFAAGIGEADVDSISNPGASNRGNNMQRDWRECELVAQLARLHLAARRSKQPPHQLRKRRYRPPGLASHGTGRWHDHQRHQRDGPQRRAEGLREGTPEGRAKRSTKRPNNSFPRRSKFIPNTPPPGTTWAAFSSATTMAIRRATPSSSPSRPIPSLSIPTAAWPSWTSRNSVGRSWSQ